MGDISGSSVTLAGMNIFDLSLGWSFKQSDHVGDEAWNPVKRIPSTVHQDLIDCKKFVNHGHRSYFNYLISTNAGKTI